jgi:phosphatidylserine decarboxylase precursor
MPLSIIPNIPFPKLYEQIDQSLNYFYFINDQEHKELEGKGYYKNSLQYHEPYRTWLINFIKEWGIYLSKKESWSDEYYKKALKDERFGLQKDWYENPSRWETFNDFFSRLLKSPDQRPIASPNDPSVVVSPSDSTPQGVWVIDKDSNFVPSDGVPIKSNFFQSIKVLIGEDSAYKNEFDNGTLTHTFLDVNDYHRFHFPIGGTIKEVRIILSDDAIGGSIKWNTELKKYILDAKDPGWQNIETRGCIIIENEKYGFVALLPIGMSQISSVNFEKNIIPGNTVRKGDMAGYFLFGGSDFVMIFQNKVNFKLTAPQDDKNNYKHLLMGEEYGRITLNK